MKKRDILKKNVFLIYLLEFKTLLFAGSHSETPYNPLILFFYLLSTEIAI